MALYRSANKLKPLTFKNFVKWVGGGFLAGVYFWYPVCKYVNIDEQSSFVWGKTIYDFVEYPGQEPAVNPFAKYENAENSELPKKY